MVSVPSIRLPVPGGRFPAMLRQFFKTTADDYFAEAGRTSAAPVGLRASEPLKMTSSILSPRRLLALCSPRTHVSASATLLLPQPLGPTMAVTPRSNASSDRSEKDLKPEISRRSRCIRTGTGGNARKSNKPCLWWQDRRRPQYLGPFPLDFMLGATLVFFSSRSSRRRETSRSRTSPADRRDEVLLRRRDVEDGFVDGVANHRADELDVLVHASSSIFRSSRTNFLKSAIIASSTMKFFCTDAARRAGVAEAASPSALNARHTTGRSRARAAYGRSASG